MSSASQPVNPSAVDDRDRTARARIRDAAIARFAADGAPTTSLKSIAADVGVSPALVIHHFGSKEGLQVACDEYVAAVIRDRKGAAMAGDSGVDPLQALREADQGPPLLRYLAQTLVDDSPHVTALVDEMVEDAVAYMAEGVENGLLTRSEYPRERAIVLVLWQLGALVLHQHVQRLLGADLTHGVEGALAWGLPAGEILAKGVIAESLYEQLREAARARAGQHDA